MVWYRKETIRGSEGGETEADPKRKRSVVWVGALLPRRVWHVSANPIAYTNIWILYPSTRPCN